MVFEINHKCEICVVELKFMKPSFQTIKRSNGPLNLIHSNISDLKFVLEVEKKYYITFI
jgi:hypothetical protein